MTPHFLKHLPRGLVWFDGHWLSTVRSTCAHSSLKDPFHSRHFDSCRKVMLSETSEKPCQRVSLPAQGTSKRPVDSSTSTGVINCINDGCIPFLLDGSRVLVRNPKTEGVTTSMNLALVPDCDASCIEVYGRRTENHNISTLYEF